MCLPNMNIPIEVDCNSGYIKTLGCFWFFVGCDMQQHADDVALSVE